MPTSRKIQAAVRLLRDNGYSVSMPEETPYQRAIRTGVKPKIWPPIVMTWDDLQHFRSKHGISTD